MLDWTDRHCRYFHRLLTRHSLLYTEMITTGAILHGDYKHLLAYSPAEHPIAIQLGGSNPNDLARCAKIAEEYGYDEINLNIGCPSDRVQSGRFGACLMAEPALVGDCISAMRAQVKIPVTIKTRIGIDENDSYEHLTSFVGQVNAAGCDTFIIHARKAWLKGLSPKENREIPPLRYEVVAQLKKDFAALTIILNGGIKSHAEIATHLEQFDGVMLGREAYHNPYLLAFVDQNYYDDDALVKTREQIIDSILPYIQQEIGKGQQLKHISRHILGLFHGEPNAKQWRRYLSENAHKADAGIVIVKNALERVVST